MNDIIELALPARSCYLPLIRGVVEKSLEPVIKDARLRNRMNLVVEEAAANIIQHAYQGSEGEDFYLAIKIAEDKLIFVLKDSGRKTPQEQIKPRPLDEIRPGGLGTHFINEIMDEVVYDLSPPEGTLLRMVKYLSATEEETK